MEMGDAWEDLPEYPNEDDFDTVKDLVVEDKDVLMLYEDGDHGYSSSEDEDRHNVDNPVLGPGSMADFMLGSGGARFRATNLHPRDWFLAFREEDVRNHIQPHAGSRQR